MRDSGNLWTLAVFFIARQAVKLTENPRKDRAQKHQSVWSILIENKTMVIGESGKLKQASLLPKHLSCLLLYAMIGYLFCDFLCLVSKTNDG